MRKSSTTPSPTTPAGAKAARKRTNSVRRSKQPSQEVRLVLDVEGLRQGAHDAAAQTGQVARRGSAARDAAHEHQPTTRKGKTQPAVDEEGQDEIADALGVVQGMKGGVPRQTLPTNANVLGMLPWAFLPRRQYQTLDLTTLEDGTFTSQQMLDLLSDAWPELSLALWNFLRLAATEYSYEVRSFDNLEEDAEGKAALDALIARVNREWGGFDQLINQWLMSVVIQGACCGETVPNAEVDDVLDIVTVQPWTIFFQRDIMQNYVAYQWQPMLAASGAGGLGNLYGYQLDGSPEKTMTLNTFEPPPQSGQLLIERALNHGGFRMLNELTFGYVPLDTEVDDPYGRLPFAPVMQHVAFDAQVLKDLRQWSHVNAWGRIDVSVIYEKVLEMMPETVKRDPTKRKAWTKQYLDDLTHAYNDLNPDDTYIHFDNVVVKSADSSGKTFQIDALVRLLERRVFRGLKQLPILMGSNEGTTETWGTLQMQVYAKGVNSIQAVVASLIEKLLTVALRIQGRTSIVKWTFEPLRAIDRINEANAEQAEDHIAAYRRDQGWITQDEASVQRTGSEAVAPAPNPDPSVAVGMPDAGVGPINADPDATASQAPAPAGSAGGDKSDTASADEGESDEQEEADDARGLPPHYFLRRTRAAQPAQRSVTPDLHHTGIMSGFFLSASEAERLALPDGEPASDLHLTLTFHGDLPEAPAQLDQQKLDALRAALSDYTRTQAPLFGEVTGIGRFNASDPQGRTPIFAAVTIPGLFAFRAGLAEALGAAGWTPDATHEYTPHITLAYLPAETPLPVAGLPNVALSLTAVTLALGGQRYTYSLLAQSQDTRQPSLNARERTLLEQAVAEQSVLALAHV